MAKNGNGGKWALGALLAAAAGYITGILTAPKSGKETREDVKNTAKKAVNETKEQLRNLQDELDKYLAEAKRVGEELTGKARDQLAGVASVAGKAKDKAKELLSAAKDGDSDDEDLKKAVSEADRALKDLKKFLKKD